MKERQFKCHERFTLLKKYLEHSIRSCIIHNNYWEDEMKKYQIVIVAIFSIISVFIMCGKEDARSPFQVIALNDHVTAVLDGGGNSLVIKGDDGCIVVDAKGDDVADAFKKEIQSIAHQPVEYLVNTHWHADHVAGNAVVGKGAVIVAHENTRKHMAEGAEMTFFGGHRDPYGAAWQPDTTFGSRFVIENPFEDVALIHVGPGHTDGDVIVWLEKSNILQTGDIYFNGMYPYIGIEAGGAINSMIERINELLLEVDENTVIVPGHGPVSNQDEMYDYSKMLVGVRDAVQALIDQGLNESDVIAAKPTKAFDDVWGKGFMKPDSFARLVYMDLSR